MLFRSVRKLAEASAKAVRETGEALVTIQSKTKQVAANMEAGAVEVEGGVVKAQQAQSAFNDIIKTGEDMSEKVKNLNLGLFEVMGCFEEIRLQSQSIMNIASESLNGTEEVASAVEEQTAAQQEITASAQILSEMADGLRRDLERFIVE